MSLFEYTACDTSGKQTHGTMDAMSQSDVLQALKAQALVPLAVHPLQTQVKTRHWRGWLQRSKRLSQRQLVLLMQTLATLLSAGIPLHQALQTAAAQMDAPQLKMILDQLSQEIQSGLSLSQAMTAAGRVFPLYIRASVRAAELSGLLGPVLSELAACLTRTQALRAKVMQALLYPALMTVVAISVVTFLMLSVVPKLLAVFTEQHQALPWATQVLLGICHFMSSYRVLLGIGLFVSIGLAIKAWQHQPTRARLQRFSSNAPFLGRYVKAYYCGRYMTTLAMLQQAGVPLASALPVAAEQVTHIGLQQALGVVTSQVINGMDLAQALCGCGYFSSMSLQFVAHGEQTGTLSTLLQRAADDYQQQLESMITHLMTLFEPCLILLMGAVVLFIVLAVLLPIFSLDQLASL